MSNYDVIRSKEGKYLIYLIEELSKLEDSIEKYFKKRSFKLNLLLEKNSQEFKDIISKELEKIKIEINDIPFDKPSVQKMEQISNKINDLVNYYSSYVGDSSE
jgi:hypothetical protein